MGKLPTLAPTSRELAKLRCKTIIMSDELQRIIEASRTDKWVTTPALRINVRSANLEHNMPGEDELAHAATYEVGASRVTKIGGTTGCTKLRFEERDGSRAVVLMKPVRAEHWKIFSDTARATGRQAGHRSRGHGPRTEFGS